jgi:magnesium-transporting ATPase (P-type)
VGPTIRDIKRAGVNVWVLTGDKVETAINIGQSCQLLTKSQNWFVLEGKTALELRTDINKRNGL